MTDLMHFEDFRPGQEFDLGALTVTREDIIEFATEFDPQPFHLDEEAGKASLLGGLAASGWHTGSLVMRLLATALLTKATCMGSPGISKLTWKQPVFPGDTLRAKAVVLDKKDLRSKPDLGIVTLQVTATNQAATDVLFWENAILFSRREASA
ncbi:MaoC family dehydratase [Labrenzia sp. 011]|uniref:MaoC family dehydratase n=1 Tax=Labrenzia sp. 011 TaxID=2171494 RepID=UPI000D52229E|nr:MaoC family dehydratase [Labrenzia sp. 011]PVB60334.1 enoyl-CoA hydratase [Labrenzia sp. 011]